MMARLELVLLIANFYLVVDGCRSSSPSPTPTKGMYLSLKFEICNKKITHSYHSKSFLPNFEFISVDSLPSDFSCSFNCDDAFNQGLCNHGIDGCSNSATGPFSKYCRNSCGKYFISLKLI